MVTGQKITGPPPISCVPSPYAFEIMTALPTHPQYPATGYQPPPNNANQQGGFSKFGYQGHGRQRGRSDRGGSGGRGQPGGQGNHPVPQWHQQEFQPQQHAIYLYIQSAHQGQKYFISYQVSQGTINTQDQVSFDSSYCSCIIRGLT